MCGIIGVLTNTHAASKLIEGLKRLEYRGYDSAGIVTVENNKLYSLKVKGKIKALEEVYNKEPIIGNIGIGHTRWATHGVPSQNNAHPHYSDKIAVVHNGIIENYHLLKVKLENLGYVFTTETDTEVILHLIDHYLNQFKNKKQAVYNALHEFEGAFAIAVVFRDDDNLIIAAKNGPPLAIGYGEGEMYLGSDSYAMGEFTNKISYLEDGEMVELTRDSALFLNYHTGDVIDKTVNILSHADLISNKGHYKHFMQKEIYEQPTVLADSLGFYLDLQKETITIPKLTFDVLNIPKITIIACGTSYYAAMVAKQWFESIAKISVEVDIASEFRYRDICLPQNGVTIFISQSGETADTMAALRFAKSHKQHTIAIVNVADSSMEREAEYSFRVHAGPEIGVASTKAFTAQLMTLACLVLGIADKRNQITKEELMLFTNKLMEVPGKISSLLQNDDAIKNVAQKLSSFHNVLYIGRGTSYAIALEGALKLKELSYIHAEAVAAGELKHGPIALIDENIPVIAIASYDELFSKMVSNIQEIAARGGKIVTMSTLEGNKFLKDVSWNSINIPDVHPFISPFIYVIPLQLLAYYVAVYKGTDVDQPRNLAKSVTVE
ncbi:Glucosamine 6-phosphate synthetase [Rickettsiales bacterium Ac37b]|nr:Glucosamine 6-phosphate synthetase [Rickettsiales bacterium Ac37b]